MFSMMIIMNSMRQFFVKWPIDRPHFFYMQILPNFTPKCGPLSNTLDEKVADFAFSYFSLISTACVGQEKL